MSTLSRPFLGTLGLVLFAACLAPRTEEVSLPPPPPPLELSPESAGAKQLSPGTEHRYRVELGAGEFTLLRFEQGEVDLAVTVAPDAGEAWTVDHSFERRFAEHVALYCEGSGGFTLTVRAVEEFDSPRTYSVQFVTPPSSASADEVARFRAGQLVASVRAHPPADRELALDQLGTLLPSLTAADDWPELLEGLYAKAEILRRAGRRDDAAAAYEEVLAKLTGPEPELMRYRASVLNVYGVNERLRGRRAQARRLFLESREHSLRFGNEHAHRIAEFNLGTLERHANRFEPALEHYQQALTLARAAGDAGLEAEALNGLAQTRLQLGDLEAAADLAREVLERARSLGSIALEAKAQSTLGLIARLDGRAEEAHRLLTDACALLRDPLVAQDLDDCEGALALTLVDLGRPAEAVALFTQLLTRLAASGRRVDQARVRFNLGVAQQALGEFRQAHATCAEALAAFEALDEVAGRASALMCQARALLALGELDGARVAAEHSLALVDSVRAELLAPALELAFVASKASYRDTYVEILMRLEERHPGRGFAALALAAADRARARQLAKRLVQVVEGLRAKLDPAASAELLRLGEDIRAQGETLAQLEVNAAPERVRIAARLDLGELVERYERTEAVLRRGHPRFAELTVPEPPSLTELQQRLLDDATELVYFALGEERSFVWHIRRAGFTWASLPPRQKLEDAVRAALSRLESGESPLDASRLERQLRELGELLLAPVAETLSGERLVVVPDGALHYLPFAALPLPGTRGEAASPRLAESFELVSVPSLAVLASLRRSPRRPSSSVLAAVGNPVLSPEDPRLAVTQSNGPGSAPGVRRGATVSAFAPLPFAAEEVEAILGLVAPSASQAMLGFEATREAALSERLRHVRLLHFASHAELDERLPERSRIVLSQFTADGRPRDGSLSLLDLYGLELNAELVVVSSCKSALGRYVRGEGIVGLSRGLFYAGARSTLVSLWNVSDRGTAQLMTRFYRHLLVDGLPRAAALRKAQLEMMAEPRWSAPYHWAGFTLQGDWQ